MSTDTDATWSVAIFDSGKQIYVQVRSQGMVAGSFPVDLAGTATRAAANLPVPAGSTLKLVEVSAQAYSDTGEFAFANGTATFDLPGRYADVIASAKAGTLIPKGKVKLDSEEKDYATFDLTPDDGFFRGPDGETEPVRIQIISPLTEENPVSVLYSRVPLGSK